VWVGERGSDAARGRSQSRAVDARLGLIKLHYDCIVVCLSLRPAIADRPSLTFSCQPPYLPFRLPQPSPDLPAQRPQLTARPEWSTSAIYSDCPAPGRLTSVFAPPSYLARSLSSSSCPSAEARPVTILATDAVSLLLITQSIPPATCSSTATMPASSSGSRATSSRRRAAPRARRPSSRHGQRPRRLSTRASAARAGASTAAASGYVYLFPRGLASCTGLKRGDQLATRPRLPGRHGTHG
jgi:hypothetical protein